jgi:hypothetical protein
VASKASWDITDDLIRSLAISEASFGQAEDTLATHQEITGTVAEEYQQINDDHKLLLPKELPEVGQTIPPDMDKWFDWLLINLKRSPNDWEPLSLTVLGDGVLGANGTQQVCPYEPGRNSVTIFNGSATLNLARTKIDAYNAEISRMVPLAAGNSITLSTEGPVWVNATIGTTFSVIKTFWNKLAIADAAEDIPEKVHHNQFFAEDVIG